MRYLTVGILSLLVGIGVLFGSCGTVDAQTSPCDAEVTVNWDISEGADRYNIYYRFVNKTELFDVPVIGGLTTEKKFIVKRSLNNTHIVAFMTASNDYGDSANSATTDPAIIMGLKIKLVNSVNIDRSNYSALAGAAIKGDNYVFLMPEEAISTVNFYLDDVFIKYQSKPPYDAYGALGSQGELDPYPFDTSTVTPGLHTIKAEITLLDGRMISIASSFTVIDTSKPGAPSNIRIEVAN